MPPLPQSVRPAGPPDGSVSLRGFARAEGGIVAVEFAFIVAILFFLAAGIVDLYMVSSYNRDMQRNSAQLAKVIAGCTGSSSVTYTNCTVGVIQDYTNRKSNMMVRTPSVQLQILQINKVNSQIRVCAGTSTALQSDVNAKALTLLDDKDVAIVVIMNYRYVPVFPQISGTLFGLDASNLQAFSIAVQVGNVTFC